MTPEPQRTDGPDDLAWVLRREAKREFGALAVRFGAFATDFEGRAISRPDVVELQQRCEETRILVAECDRRGWWTRRGVDEVVAWLDRAHLDWPTLDHYDRCMQACRTLANLLAERDP